MQPFRFRIDGDDPLEMEKLVILVIEDFKIGMDHFPVERKSGDLTGRMITLPRFESASQKGLAPLEPFGLENSGAVIDVTSKILLLP